ncbi:MAG: hypothetical protein EON58_15950 [Alphaproteobacteria bacterium]|nr:MAG: hypothetical protein EON58_15950 [Alphaproteobacteria bacterium]
MTEDELNRRIELAMAVGSVNALSFVVDLVSELQDEHDAAPLMGRYELMLNNWIKLQLSVLNEYRDIQAQVAGLSED